MYYLFRTHGYRLQATQARVDLDRYVSMYHGYSYLIYVFGKIVDKIYFVTVWLVATVYVLNDLQENVRLSNKKKNVKKPLDQHFRPTFSTNITIIIIMMMTKASEKFRERRGEKFRERRGKSTHTTLLILRLFHFPWCSIQAIHTISHIHIAARHTAIQSSDICISIQISCGDEMI